MERVAPLSLLCLSLLCLSLLSSCAKADASAIPPPASAGAVAGADDEDDLDAEAPAAIPDVGGDAVVRKIVQLGHTDSQVDAILEELTKAFGPRLTGSHNLMAAEVWCRDKLAGWGLKAELERWGQLPVGFDRGPWSGAIVGPTETPLEFTTPAWTPGALGPVRGPARAYPAGVRQAKADRDQWAGAWVLKPRDGGRAEKVETKIDDALRDAKIAGFVTPARDDKGLVHTGGRSDIDWNTLPRDVQVVLQAPQYLEIEGLIAKGQAVELEFSIDNRFFRGPVPVHNVIAEIPGTDKADEYVIVGGHIDSWDGAVGANDNGTGVATTMEAARLLMAAGARPRRTIQFMLWSGEEQGLLGSRGYVEAHPEQMDKISAVFVHDGGTNYLSGLAVTPEMMPQMQQAFAPVMKLAPDKMPFELTESDGLRPGGSDHTPFIRAGAPGFFWNQEGESDYDFVHHTQHDTLEHVVSAYQHHSAMVVAIGAYQLANLDEMLDRRNSEPVPRRRLGASVSDGRVRSLRTESVAGKAGLKTGDVIVAVDGKSVDGRRELGRALQEGGPIKTLTVERDGARIDLKLDWSKDPDEAKRSARRRTHEGQGAK